MGGAAPWDQWHFPSPSRKSCNFTRAPGSSSGEPALLAKLTDSWDTSHTAYSSHACACLTKRGGNQGNGSIHQGIDSRGMSGTVWPHILSIGWWKVTGPWLLLLLLFPSIDKDDVLTYAVGLWHLSWILVQVVTLKGTSPAPAPASMRTKHKNNSKL